MSYLLSNPRKGSTIERLSGSQKKWLWDAAKHYREQMPGSEAEEYLRGRGLAGPEMTSYGLGFVAEPLRTHDQYRGMLAIPYFRVHPDHGPLVVSIRFRRLDNSDPKYMTQAGDRPRLYNTVALTRPSPSIAITEGEIDAITSELVGIGCVGVPGAQAWQPHFREPFLGYRDVYVLADGDEAGQRFANAVAKSLPNARVIPMPPGEDVNSLVLKQGREALLERIHR